MLALGPVPSYVTAKKKKKTDEDDEDTADEEEPEDTMDNPDEEEEHAFFVAPEETVQTRGTILITLRNVPPYTLWYYCPLGQLRLFTEATIDYRDVPRLAKKPPAPTTGSTPSNPPFTLLRSFEFIRGMWKGYEHRMTKGERAHGTGRTGEGGEDRTWEFCLSDVKAETGYTGPSNPNLIQLSY